MYVHKDLWVSSAYPVQCSSVAVYASKAEQDGTVERNQLDENPEEYARDLVCRRTKYVEEDPSNCHSEFDLTTKEGKQMMLHDELPRRQAARGNSTNVCKAYEGRSGNYGQQVRQ